MGKLSLQPNPTFHAEVVISPAGGPDVKIDFTFKHRTRAELDAFVAASANRPDADSILEMCTAWELTDPFTRESLELLTQNYISASRAIFDTYVDELTKGRRKN